MLKILSMFLEHDSKNQSAAFQTAIDITIKKLLSEIHLIKLFI